MRRRDRLDLLIILIFSIVYSANATNQNREILFENISNKNGLSHSTVFTAIQDSTGYMWFGTQDGLNRYDGYAFTVYRPNDNDPNTPASNYIRSLFLDHEGILWIGGDKGITRFDEKSNRFENYHLISPKTGIYITAITQTPDGSLWACSRNGKFFKYDHSSNQFNEIKTITHSEQMDDISTLYPVKNGILIGSDTGLFHLNLQTLQLPKIHLNDKTHPIRQIIESADQTYWLATEGEGIIQIDSDFNLLRQFRHDVFNSNSLCNDNVRSLCFDDAGRLWVGTFIGLSIVNLETHQFTNYFEEFSRPYALTQNSVRSIFRDTNGGMWLGTFFGGIDYYHPANIKFDLLNQNGGKLSLSDNVVSAMKEDPNGNLWILTNDKGLNYWDRKRNTIRVISHDEKNPNSISANNLKSITYTNTGKLLIGTHNSGLNYYDPRTGKNIVYKHSNRPGSIADNSVYALLKDSKNRLWVGTWKGLNRFDETTRTFSTHYIDSKGQRLTSDQISFLFEDSRHRIWIGTFNGINIYYPDKNIFETFQRTPSNDIRLRNNEISCISEDSKGRIWIGTRKGVHLFDEIERNFISITTQDGLANNTIYGILEDDHENLWISSNGGLSCYHIKTKKVRNYGVKDGVQSSQFNNYSFCKTSNGQFLFGGINGITLFDPEKIEATPFNPHVIFTHFKLFNDVIQPNDASGLLEKSINHTRKITLKHNQNVFSIGFTAINYIGADKITYHYLLDGFDKAWREAESGRSAYYSNLRPGHYTFRVKASGMNSDTAEQETTLKVEVLTPWWLSKLAYISYFILMTALTWLGYHLLKERIRTQNQLRLERLEKHKITEVNKMKLQFFTNISHEFRTPLTLIISPLQKIIERHSSDEWLNRQHETIYKNARRLMNLIDQLMDFRKSELGQLKLNAAPGEIVSFINEIYLSFALAASQNNIIYTFDSKEKKIDCYFDRSYLEKIAFNLLSNAFKFTPAGGTIGIQLYIEDKWIVLEVKDSGKGIPPEKLSLIFERFYRIDENNSKPGSGIGLALTKRLVEQHHGAIDAAGEVGKGSIFTVRIPLNAEVYHDDEISTDAEIRSEGLPAPLIEMDASFDEKVPDATNEKTETILLVEDNAEIIRYISENLEEKYLIKSAANGKEALDLIMQEEPTLVVSDIMMPVMDGLSFCKTVKQNVKTCHIPIILLTAKTSVDDQIEGLHLGADDYVVKPFEMNLLEAKIQNIIKTRKRLKELFSKSNDIKPEAIAFNNLDKEFLEKAVIIVEKYLADAEFSVDQFAQEMGMSRSNLHLKMKAITGGSATDFIKKIRFNEALKLLEENRYSVAEISYMIGFNSPSYFSTSFKKHFGYLPTEHIQKIKNRSN